MIITTFDGQLYAILVCPKQCPMFLLHGTERPQSCSLVGWSVLRACMKVFQKTCHATENSWKWRFTGLDDKLHLHLIFQRNTTTLEKMPSDFFLRAKWWKMYLCVSFQIVGEYRFAPICGFQFNKLLEEKPQIGGLSVERSMIQWGRHQEQTY